MVKNVRTVKLMKGVAYTGAALVLMNYIAPYATRLNIVSPKVSFWIAGIALYYLLELVFPNIERMLAWR